MQTRWKFKSTPLNLTVLILFAINTHLVIASETEKKSIGHTEVSAFISKLKKQYQETLKIDAFSLKYHFLNRRYRDFNYWDYQTPNLHMSQRLVEMDLDKKHFYDNDIVYYSGGGLYDRVQFQSDIESFFYEKSDASIGRQVIRQSMDSYDRFKRHMMINIDFLAIRPLIANRDNIAKNNDLEAHLSIDIDQHTNTTTVTHSPPDKKIIEYHFDSASLQLKSINHGDLDGIFVYDDYQASRGITFARSVYQYYDGETKPTYIKYIDSFDVIDEVDPDKLTLPQQYYSNGTVSEIKRGDGILVAKELAPDLYLITDSSEVRNSLLRITGDKITLFGAAGSVSVVNNTIKLIEEQFPDKHLSTVYVTHPHNHQINGLPIFAQKGAIILADAYTISAIKAFPKFANDVDKFEFQTLEHRQVIDGIHFYILENMYSKRQSFVYFKDSGIIFQSQFLRLAKDNTLPRVIPSYTRTFIDFVKSEGLDFKRIVGNYRNNNISVCMFNKIDAVNF